MIACLVLVQSPVTVLERAHSHNDYAHARPLEDALDNGFSSIEVDLYLEDGQLLVGHDRKDLRRDRTFQSLYLGPLARRVKENGGWVYPRHYKTFWVLIDFKTDGAPAYEAFKAAIQKVPEFRSVRFVISGNRPVETVARENGRYAVLDGRWPDLDKGYPATVMPLVSEAWGTHFSWKGDGPIPSDQWNKLLAMVKRAHDQGRKIRFWGAPDEEALWSTQWKAGVDWINTDRLSELRSWMVKQPGVD